jgi:uncharacterized glyoxalase superfamily protein PhnB
MRLRGGLLVPETSPQPVSVGLPMGTPHQRDRSNDGGKPAMTKSIKSEVSTLTCACCGEERDAAMVVPLLCHDEMKVCRVCLGWLLGRAGGIDVTPTLPVRDMDEATRFYEAAGFEVEHYSDDFAFVRVDDQSVFDVDRIEGLDAEHNHAGCYVITDAVDEWHSRFIAAGLQVTPIEDMPWGMHEFTLTDPSGNHIRIGKAVAEG